MESQDAAAAYTRLSSSNQALVLIDHASAITVIARGTYSPATDDVADPRRLRMLNEVQHRIMGHIAHLLNGNGERYPDDLIFQLVTGEGDPELLACFASAVSRRS